MLTDRVSDCVQRVLAERESYSIKQRRNRHYVRGLLTCARCNSRMLYTTGKAKSGDTFDYYICSKRHKRVGLRLALPGRRRG